ncbi:hypothetical protein MP477_10735 [Chryseobacterium sp. WG23]|uniref:hypothetical protein n=1 Tax=Chryseobacterium sp. WG23 TaxID=2926910 RepID=UPI00211EBBE3|nr:hypothetical protein [Chryseobacterium sp. WG23]MCQ9635432.1 hypothetical protein [Chryseobacterium sp. WG23]
MKKLIFIFSLLTIISCSSVKYYEYYHNDNITEMNSKYAYCTLEVHKDKVIYRAFNNSYVYKEKEPISFLYIETGKMSDLDYIPLWKASKFYYYIDENQKKVIDYTLLSDADIKLLGGYFKENNLYKRESKQPEDYHFNNYNLNRIAIWFPSELKRVQKINYSKFPKEIQKINLVNPDSEKGNIK